VTITRRGAPTVVQHLTPHPGPLPQGEREKELSDMGSWFLHDGFGGGEWRG